ncbi:MAG: hypothetical protein E3J43_03090 [Candidatus Heimdallarchaeota archaeon]|nr:MAG: hypothetical protein E3J43_03090 [Candidatus Heimdallarchaeota archaeon]
MGKIGKMISSLIFLGLFGSWFTFTIWGIVQWTNPASFISNKTTISLLYVPLFIGMFILFVILGIIVGAAGKKKKKDEEKKDFIPKDIKDKFGKFFEKKAGDTAEGEEIADKIPKEIKDKFEEFFKKIAEES